MVVALAAVVMAGCHGYYGLTIENHTRETVVVSLAIPEYHVRPCSVLIRRNVPGDSYRSIPIRVTTDDGSVILSEDRRPEKNEKGLLELLVRIPSAGTGECPEPLTGFFLLTVTNHTWSEVTVWLEDQLIDRLPSGSTKTLGPFPGTWMDVRTTLTVRDPAGKPLDNILNADYDLGEIPDFIVSVGP
jgi:hypothetical protein